MNILYVSEYFPPYDRGGAEISTSLIIKYVSDYAGCFVLTEGYQKEPWKFGSSTIYPVLKRIHMGQRSFLSMLKYGINIIIAPLINILRISSFIKKHNIDIIHFVPTAYYYAVLVIAAILAKKPFIIDIRNYSLVCPVSFSSKYCKDNNYNKHNYNCLKTSYSGNKKTLRGLYFLIAMYEYIVFYLQIKFFKLALRFTGKYRIIPNSEFVRDTLIKDGYPGDKIQVIHNIINIAPGRKKRYSKKNTIVFAGQLEEFKGIWDLVFAFEMLSDKGFSLVIAGDGREAAGLKKYTKDKKISNIKFLGKVPNEMIQDLYRGSKIVAAPSIFPEPFGRFILESMIAGTPLVTTNVGGSPEGIKNRKTGILVEPADPAGLSGAIKELIEDGILYQTIAENLKSEINKYSPEVIGQQRLKLYKSLVQDQ